MREGGLALTSTSCSDAADLEQASYRSGLGGSELMARSGFADERALLKGVGTSVEAIRVQPHIYTRGGCDAMGVIDPRSLTVCKVRGLTSPVWW